MIKFRSRWFIIELYLYGEKCEFDQDIFTKVFVEPHAQIITTNQFVRHFHIEIIPIVIIVFAIGVIIVI